MRNVRTSSLLNVYLVFTVFFDAAKSRSFSLAPYYDMISILFTTRVGVKLFLAIFEARGKENILLPQYTNLPPEATAGIINRVFFWWQNPLFKRGYSNTLTVDDLFQLDKHLKSEYLHHVMQTAWDKGMLARFSMIFNAQADPSRFGSNQDETQYSLHADSEQTEMAGSLCCSAQGCINGAQLLSTLSHQPSHYLLRTEGDEPDQKHWLWLDRRIRPGLRWYRGKAH